MANYTTLLKTWGDTGSEYPDGYSYLEGEQPVDAWDNYLIYNVVDDLQSLIGLTNDRIESGKGTSTGHPSSPESSHLYYDEENERLETWDAGLSEWHGLMKVDGDTMQGALDMGGYGVSGVGSITLSGTVDGVDVAGHAADGAAHHTKYTDSDATGAVEGNTFNSLSVSGHLGNATYATEADVPALSKGEMVYVDGQNALYVEDGS